MDEDVDLEDICIHEWAVFKEVRAIKQGEDELTIFNVYTCVNCHKDVEDLHEQYSPWLYRKGL